MDDTTMTATSGNPTTSKLEEKTFTQEQVNAIVQDRLARDRSKYEAELEQARQHEVMARKQLVAMQSDVPPDQREKYIQLAERMYSDMDFEEAYKRAVADFPPSTPPEAALPCFTRSLAGSQPPRCDPIRESMGLDRRE